ncbi:hypothetical protein MNAN1_001187 [Malassezia nana]|uniref:Uncharacterized protein n=1 Tax=Malassezia nana TaxID=180528 RepID=A0AAF0EKH7_9BASI|nr:hypothetical protein MNAN1_001187 [Malassezia nana]
MPSRHAKVTPRNQPAPVEPRIRTPPSNRLKCLLTLLAITTLLLVAQQLYRLRRHNPLQHCTAPLAPSSAVHTAPVPVEEEGNLPVQFDEDGELDLGTMERV